MSEVLDNKEVAKIYIDARGPRFGATITTLVLAIALVTQNKWVIVAQGLVFLIGAVKGPQFTPYGLIFKNVIKPRLSGVAPTEDVRPPKFAQAVGFVFALVAGIAAFAGADLSLLSQWAQPLLLPFLMPPLITVWVVRFTC